MKSQLSLATMVAVSLLLLVATNDVESMPNKQQRSYHAPSATHSRRNSVHKPPTEPADDDDKEGEAEHKNLLAKLPFDGVADKEFKVKGRGMYCKQKIKNMDCYEKGNTREARDKFCINTVCKIDGRLDGKCNNFGQCCCSKARAAKLEKKAKKRGGDAGSSTSKRKPKQKTPAQRKQSSNKKTLNEMPFPNGGDEDDD